MVFLLMNKVDVGRAHVVQDRMTALISRYWRHRTRPLGYCGAAAKPTRTIRIHP